ncbi:Uncharacterized conserved protein, contains WD40 repeats [Phaffia rhodozyma]|uniref:Uncharacterized conserved protein, contains WD40 repeats n=1 Tax=Phaffia rhodozyma TaxID=264483 RepID=A0A0F7SJH8_PHARH|nr:Uncharacterized conserved protein, contains WD40 repeats [Phaffia rhodozyma]
MHLGRHSVSSVPIGIFNQITVNQQSDTFALATNQGFQIWNLHPLQLLADRQLPGSIGHASLLHRTSLVFLLGGGVNPLYPLNKLIIWDDRFQTPVLELEFREKILGVTSRRGLLALSFRKRVVLLTIDGFGEEDYTDSKRPKRRGKERESITESQIPRVGATDDQGKTVGGLKWFAEWETCDNPRGLLALSTSPLSTLLTIPGRQPGHVHLLHLPPCPFPLSSSESPLSSTPPYSLPPPSKSALLIAHTHPLSTLSCPPSGRFFSTSSDRGTLIRVWDGRSGGLVKELRRGADQAVVWGVGWLPPPRSAEDGDGDGKEGVIVWSDKGTIHVFTLEEGGKVSDKGKLRNPKSPFQTLQPYLPISLPKYFLSEWSHAQFRLPTRTPHAETLTHLSPSSPSDLPSTSTSSTSTSTAQSASSVRSGSSSTAMEDKCLVSWVQVHSSSASGTAAGISTTPYQYASNPSLSFKSRPSTSEITPSLQMEYQLIALTYTGGYYRIALPSSSSSSSSVSSPLSSSHEGSASSLGSPSLRETDRIDIEPTESGIRSGSKGGSRGCKLVEFRRFGQDSNKGFLGGSGRGSWNEGEKW